MVLSINQETFDGTVKENMDEFGLTVEEAIKDTVEQYEAQGVDLSKVIVDLMACNIDIKPITEAVEALKNLVSNHENCRQYIPELIKIRKECEKGLQYKVLVGKEGVYKIIVKIIKECQGDIEVHKECFNTLIALMSKQPDLLDQAGIIVMMKTLDKQKDEETLVLLLKWVKECCVLHEENRQHIFDAGILEHLKHLLNLPSSRLLCAIMTVLRALVLDDDIRVEFGRAHEHARAIASDTLCALTGLLQKFKSDEMVINELMLTLSALLVRTEFCKKVEDIGGLTIIQNAMIEFYENEKVTRNCLKVIKALAGNDDCKAHIIKNGAGPIIINSLNKHKEMIQTATIGLSCITALTLRNADNSRALFECGAPKLIADIMKLFPENENVQKNASWAIRNMVSRSRYQNKEFLHLDMEQLLKFALKKYPKIEYDVKAALRDLECEVELKEEWTGKGGKLTTEEKI